jgi:hypothetical protein
VLVGRTNAGDASTGHRATSDRWVTHPSYAGQTEYDVALVHLSQPVPGVEPVRLADVAQFEAFKRTPLMLVGYGRVTFDDPADSSLSHTRTVFKTNNSRLITTEPLGERTPDRTRGTAAAPEPSPTWTSGRVFYRSFNGHVRELLLRQGSGWFNSDIRKVADAPDAWTDPIAYATAQGSAWSTAGATSTSTSCGTSPTASGITRTSTSWPGSAASGTRGRSESLAGMPLPTQRWCTGG